MEFEAAVESFLRSVQERDFKTFEQFFHSGLEFQAVLPGGVTFHDTASFLESQKAWFLGKTGSFHYKVERLEMSDELGVAITKVDYANQSPEGHPFSFEIYILFVFRKTEGRWFLVYDQNTVL